MRARAVAVVEAPSRLVRLDCAPPLTLRRVHTDDPATCALCLVGSAAGPLAGDDLELDVRVCRDARASLQSTGAALALGGGGRRRLTTRASVAAGGRLHARPAPLVAAAGSCVDVTVEVDFAPDATVGWHEILVLGRSSEPAGALTMRWDVTCAGRPVLRQFVDLADPPLATWAGLVGSARVLATSLVHDPSRRAHTRVYSGTAVVAELGEHTTLTTVLGTDVADVRSTLAALDTATPA